MAFPSYGNLSFPKAAGQSLGGFVINPGFEGGDTNADGVGNYWSDMSSAVGTKTWTLEPGRLGGKCQRVRYTGAAGDSAGNKIVRLDNQPTDTDTFAAGAYGAGYFWVKGSVSGCTVNLNILWRKNDETLISSYTAAAVTLTDQWQYVPFLTTAAPANTGRARFSLQVMSIGTGDTCDVYFDDCYFYRA